MNTPHTTRRLLAAACVSMATAATAAAAIAGPAPPNGPPSEVVDFPAGAACAGLPMRLEGWSGHQNEHVLKDKNGFVNRAIFLGRGAAFRMTNMDSGKSLATRNNGAQATVEFDPVASSSKQTINRHMLLVW